MCEKDTRTIIEYERAMERGAQHLFALLRRDDLIITRSIYEDVMEAHAALVYPAAIFDNEIQNIVARSGPAGAA
jgi:hypothetical protein